MSYPHSCHVLGLYVSSLHKFTRFCVYMSSACVCLKILAKISGHEMLPITLITRGDVWPTTWMAVCKFWCVLTSHCTLFLWMVPDAQCSTWRPMWLMENFWTIECIIKITKAFYNNSKEKTISIISLDLNTLFTHKLCAGRFYCVFEYLILFQRIRRKWFYYFNKALFFKVLFSLFGKSNDFLDRDSWEDFALY